MLNRSFVPKRLNSRRRRATSVSGALLALAGLVGVSACGEMPLSGRYEGTFSQTIQIRETSFGAQGASSVTETEIRNTQNRPLLIASGIASDGVLEGLACPSIPLFFDDGALTMERSTSCEGEFETETNDGNSVQRSTREETIEIDSLDIVEVESDLIEIDGVIRREFTVVDNGIRSLTHEEDIEFHFEGARLAPATGAM